MHLEIGMEAPHFELATADMTFFRLSSAREKQNVVLYFYPKDDTPSCTMEANEFSDHDEEFARLDTLVVGVSRDDSISHASFRDKYGLSVLLLADTESRVCKKYGVLYDKVEHDGSHHAAIQRSTFIIDKQGLLRHVLYGIHAHKHPLEVLNLIKEMK